MHYASALIGLEPEAKVCYDLLIESGASEMTLDVEGYTPINYKKIPRLIDMAQVRGLNRCESHYLFIFIVLFRKH